MSFGKLLIFDLKECNKFFLNDKIVLQHFINHIIEMMKMKKIGNTIFEYFEPNDFNIANDLVGFSITQIISLSSITIHICEGSGNVYIDIFTCCEVNEELYNKVKDYILYVFNPISLNEKIIER